ncbi:MAG TPA: hypothetical protein VHM31_18945 [Polyangia bacterium]|nr:hypothetical protein [Polyangia bacterium]
MSQMDLGATDRRQRIDHLRGMLAEPQPTTAMEEILRLLRHEALDPAAQFESTQGQVVVQSLDDLEHEVSRLDPDRTRFDRQVRILIDVLSGQGRASRTRLNGVSVARRNRENPPSTVT